MKKFLFVLIALLVSGCATQVTAGLQQLPDEGRALVFMIVTAGVTWALLKLGEVLKIDLSGWSNTIAAVLAPVLVAILERYLQLIPSVFDNIVLTIIHLIVLLVGSLGTIWIVQRKPAPSLR